MALMTLQSTDTMSDAQRSLSARPGFWIGLLAVALVIALCAAVVRNDAAPAPVPPNSFVGTWATSGGVVLQLRSDGSARVRYPKSPDEPVVSFRWEIEDDQLRFVMSQRTPKTIKGMVYGVFDTSGEIEEDVDYFEIIHVATEQALLIARPRQGEGGTAYPMQWTRTEDAILDAAP